MAEPAAETEMEEPLGVILDDPESADIRDLGEVLASVLEIPRADATHRARYGRGTLLEAAEAHRARRLVTALKEKGVLAFAVPGPDLAGVPQGTRVKEVRLAAEGISAKGWTSSEPIRLSWTEIEAISIYALEEEAEALDRSDHLLHAVSERSMGPGGVKLLEEVQERRKKGIEVLIRCDLISPFAGHLLRLDRDCPIYGGSLTDEGRHSLERFLGFLDEAVARSGAFLPVGSQAFLEDPRLRPILLAGAGERQGLNIWLWQMLKMGRLEGRG